MAKKEKDITKTGPQRYTELQNLNEEAIRSRSDYYDDESVGRLLSHRNISARDPRLALPKYVQSSIAQSDQGDYWGNSMFDESSASALEFENLGDIRAENQPWFAQLGAGIAKGLVLAGTTFLDGTIGLITGAATGIANMADDDPNTGFWNGLWNNPFSQAMQSINDWSESVMPNYYSSKELEEPWYENLFTANFIGDKFIKNLGFSVGALYSGGVASKAITPLAKMIGGIARSAGASQMVASTTGAIVSAINEGRVEAINNSRDWFNLEKKKLDDYYDEKVYKEFAPLYEEAKAEYESTKGTLVQGADGKMYDPALLKYQQTVADLERQRTIRSQQRTQDEKYNKTLSKLTEDRLGMGTMDLLMNLPILTFSNIIQFSKFYTRGFDTSRRVASDIVRGKKGAALAATKGALSEGTEEILQKAASTVSGKFYEKDMNWFERGIDPSASQQLIDFIDANVEGISETFKDISSWEEFFIGGLTGAIGIPKFRGIRNSNGKLQLPIGLEGGARQHYREHMEKLARLQKVEDYMNGRIGTREFLNYYQGLTRHKLSDAEMEDALSRGDKFDYKNAEHNQMIEDIIMFDSASKLNDFRSNINAAYDTSDENLVSIVQNTTSVTDDRLSGPFAEFASLNPDGSIRVDLESSRAEITDILTKKRDEIFNAIDKYKKIKDNLDAATNGALTDDQLSELTWMQSRIDNWGDRMESMRGPLIETLNRASQIIASRAPYVNNEEVERRVGSITTMVDILSRNTKLNPRSFNNTLIGLSNIISSISEDIGEHEVNQALYTIYDYFRAQVARNKTVEKFNELFKDFSKIDKEHEDAIRRTQERVDESKKQGLASKIQEAKSISDIRDIIREEQDSNIVESVLSQLESEGDEVTKAKIKNYKETSLYDRELQEVLNSSGESRQTIDDALKLWQDHTSVAENLEQIGNPNSVHINNEEAFAEASEDLDIADTRFQTARYALQKAMSNVNNSLKFKDRFSPEFKKPANAPVKRRGIDKDTTGDSGTTTVPPVNPGTVVTETPTPVGDIAPTDVVVENKEANDRVQTQKDLDDSQQGKRRYYRPAIPELHITASRNGDFRPFDVVVAERERSVDFSVIYNYLRDNGAFKYVNEGNLKVGDTLGFMIDPDFNDHTIFIIDTRNNQIVGSIDEGSSLNNYEGLSELVSRIRAEYQTSRQLNERGKGRSNKITKPYYFSSVVNQIGGKKSSWEYYRDSTQRTIGGIVYVTGETYGGTLRAAIKMAVETGVISRKYLKYLDRTKDDAIELEDLQEIIDAFKEKGINNPDDLINFIEENATSTPNAQPTGRFYATPQTRVSKMMVGRIPYSSEERSLADIPGVLDGDAKPMFGIIKNGILTTNGKVDDRLIIKPVDMSEKEGRLYLLIPNAAGTYSPVAVRVKHFNNQEFNLEDATVANTAIGKAINSALDALSKCTNESDLEAAYKELSKVLYTGNLHIDWFESSAGNGIRISRVERDSTGAEVYITDESGNKVRKEDVSVIYFQNFKEEAEVNGMSLDIGAARESVKEGTYGPEILKLFLQEKSTEDIKRDLLDALLGHNLPIQVDASNINTTGYNNRLINSNILTSNLREARVLSSWFTTDYFDAQGNLHEASSPASVTPPPTTSNESPVGGTEQTTTGTTVKVGKYNFVVDLKSMVFTDEDGKKHIRTDKNANIFAMAWAQETYGDATEFTGRMVDNKVVTPQGKVLDRNTGQYLSEEEAQKIKNRLAGKNEAPSVTESAVESEKESSNLPIFEEREVSKDNDRTLPEDAFEEGGEIGFYEKGGKIYRGYIKKIGEVEVTTGSGQKIMIPIHVSKYRDRGFGNGQFGSTSEYIVVFPNGYALTMIDRGTEDAKSFDMIMKALSAKPEKVLSLSSEKTQIHNPRILEEMEAESGDRQYSPETTQSSGAVAAAEMEDAINNTDDEFEDELELRRVDSDSREIWNKEKELAWLDKVLPQLSEQDRIRVVKGLIQVGKNGPVAWGMFSDGIMTLSDIAAEGTTYHEAFHVVFHLILTPQEREKLLNEARQIFGDKSAKELEEDMAEGFREYVTSQESRGLGRRILDFFKNLFAKVTNWKYVKPSLTNYYRMINQGRYSSYTLSQSSVERLRTISIEELGNIIDREFKEAKRKVAELNSKRYSTEQEARNAFNKSGINKELFYRITREGAKNARGYKIQLLTKEKYKEYKDRILEEQEVLNELSVENRYFDSLDPDIQMRLFNKGWTKEKFDSVSQAERDHAVECAGL